MLHFLPEFFIDQFAQIFPSSFCLNFQAYRIQIGGGCPYKYAYEYNAEKYFPKMRNQYLTMKFSMPYALLVID